ncbi:MAG: hypothetical protein LC640_04690 [Frankia sp.]|nr:hypothetical protein [Frankia sp.]
MTNEPIRSTTMHLIHEELARSHQRERQREAAEQARAVRVRAARRWQRRAEYAARRARWAAAAIQ